jgi:hypothetical protein
MYGRNTYTTIRQECIQVMSYGRNIYTTIREEDIKVMSYCRNTYTHHMKSLIYQRGNQKP